MTGPAQHHRDSVPTGSVARALRILTAVADATGPVQVTSLARELGLSNSTTHRMLRILTDEGWVQQLTHDYSYNVGATFYRLSTRIVSKVPISDTVQPFIQAIAKKFGETTLLGLHLAGEHAMAFIAREDGTHPLQYRISMHQPSSLLWGSSGKVILAHLPEESARKILEHETLSPAGDQEPPEWQELAEQLDLIRKVGYALSSGEKLPGARGVAAPVFDANGILGSLIITGPQERMTKQRETDLIQAVTEGAKNLSNTLSGTLPMKGDI